MKKESISYNDNEKREVAKIVGDSATTSQNETLIINGQIYK